MKDKIYVCYCHGCGVMHGVKAIFLSTPLAKEVGRYTYPVSACPKCMAEGPEFIRHSYDRFIKGFPTPAEDVPL